MHEDLRIKFCLGIFESYSNLNLEMINFCREEQTRKLILLKTIEYFLIKKQLTNENLIKLIPDFVSSRSHKINSINLLISKKIIHKIKSNNDKRTVNIVPSKEILHEFEEYFKCIKSVF